MSQYLLIRWNASTSNYTSCLEQTYQQIPIDLNRWRYWKRCSCLLVESKRFWPLTKGTKVLLLDKCDLRQLEACRRTPRVTNYVTTVYLYPVKFDFEITLLTLIKIKMWRTKFLAVTLLLIMLARDTKSWRRRRRSPPPPCPVRNCQVGSWSSWGACSHQCGTSGTQRRSRSKTVVETCGGTCHYPLTQNRACNRDACKNSGTPHSSGCSCRPGYQGTCCESGKLCPIDH